MSDTSLSSCVAYYAHRVNHKTYALGLTHSERASLLRSGAIKSIARPMPGPEVTTAYKARNGGPVGINHPNNVAAFREIIALGAKIKRGQQTEITIRHGGHLPTVQKMVWNISKRKRYAKKKSA